MSDLLEDAADKANIQVRPHWLPCGNRFWYRQHTNRGLFFVVHIPTRTKRLAFDHEALAKALSASSGEEHSAQKLPVKSIEFEGDDLQFRYHGKRWQFNGKLESREEVEDDQHKASKSELKASVHTGESVDITFVNVSHGVLDYEWLDFRGDARSYGTLQPGQSKVQPTYEGHVWQLVKSDGTIIAKFEATRDGCTASSDDKALLTEEDARPPPKVSIDGPNVTIRNADDTKSTIHGILPRGHSWSRQTNLSPDGQLCVLWERTPPQDHPLNLIVSVPDDQLQPKLKTVQYLKPGDRIEVLRPRLFEVKGEVEIILDDKLFSNPYEIRTIGWNKSSDGFSFVYNQRGHQIIRVINIGRDGVKTIIEEKSETFIDYSSKLYFEYLEESDELLWTSERDGWNRLYLVDMVNGMSRAITPRDQVFRSVDRIDKNTRQIWYVVYGLAKDQDPYYAHLARTNFDGTGLTTLTSTDGDHSWDWSPDHRFLLDTWSRVDAAPNTVLKDGTTGEELLEVERGDLNSLIKSGWTVPEQFQAPSRDGKHQIYGIIIKPSHFNKEKSYPIIEHIYAGPHDQHTPKSFSLLRRFHELANLGFIVVSLDGMGTNWRCKAFHDVCYKNLRDAGFPDRIAWMKAAAADRPWMDTSRVGIYGGSAGGQSAMGALLFHNDFYKAAVSDCGCHDNRMDKLWWNEQWMGWPIDESYERSSNAVHADKLEGKLMLMASALDTNVDPSSTWQVIHALNEADKDYELVFFPMGDHGEGLESKYGWRRAKDFFCRHLLN